MQYSKKLSWEGAWHVIVLSPDPQYGTHMRKRRVCVCHTKGKAHHRSLTKNIVTHNYKPTSVLFMLNYKSKKPWELDSVTHSGGLLDQ